MQNIDWMWTLSGLIWMIGCGAGFYLAIIGKDGLEKLLGIFSSLPLALLGFSIFLCGVGVTEGDSEPWEHVNVLLMVGNLFAAFLMWRIFRRFF